MISHTLTDLARATGLPVLKRAAGAVTRLVPIPQPLLMVGPGAAARMAAAVGDFGHRRLLVVTDAMIVKLGLLAPITAALERSGTAFDVFDEVEPDAPIPVVERGLLALRRHRCDAVLAVGGGSVIDAAKVIALAATNPKALRDLAGYFRGLHGPLPIYAVPTTAGTGSEVTVAAVISDPDAQRKLVVADTRLVPDMAALDPTLMVGLPPAVTAATGMDALTHAIEAYISQWATPATDRLALAAVREDDIPALAQAACREADLNYPVPRVMSRDDCEALLRQILPAGAAAARRRPAAKAPKAAKAAAAPAAKLAKTTTTAKAGKAGQTGRAARASARGTAAAR